MEKNICRTVGYEMPAIALFTQSKLDLQCDIFGVITDNISDWPENFLKLNDNNINIIILYITKEGLSFPSEIP